MTLPITAPALRFVRVSRRRTDLQDDSRWPAPVMRPNGAVIVKSGPGWVLLLEQTP